MFISQNTISVFEITGIGPFFCQSSKSDRPRQWCSVMPYANVVCLEPLSNGIPDERWISIGTDTVFGEFEFDVEKE